MELMRGLPFLALIALVSAVRGNRRGDTSVSFTAYTCWTEPSRVKIGTKSAVTLNIRATAAESSDPVSGRNLWRVGVFGSERPDGSGERHGYVEQILTRKQASKPVEAGGALKLKNIRTRFNMGQIGCGPVAYFCVEFARNERSSVDFELRMGNRNSIVTCERLNCSRPYASAGVPAEATSDKVRLMFDAFRWDSAITGFCPGGVAWVNLNISVPVREDSDSIVNGTFLWRVSLYGSSDPAGRSGERRGLVTHALPLGEIVHPPDILPGQEFHLTGKTKFNISGIGCDDTDIKYLCVVIEHMGALADPDFEIANRPDKRSMVSCERRSQCLTPETIQPFLVAQDMLRNGASRSFVGWLLSAMTSDSELTYDQFISSLSSSNIEALPEAAPEIQSL